MLSYFESNFIENSFGKVFLFVCLFFLFLFFLFQILAKIKMMQNKNRLFGRHFETVQHLKKNSGIMIFYRAYIYDANLILFLKILPFLAQKTEILGKK